MSVENDPGDPFAVSSSTRASEPTSDPGDPFVRRRADNTAKTEDDGGAFEYVDNIVRAIADGITLGYSDEIAAGLTSLFTGQDREEVFARENQRTKEFREENPLTTLGANIAGAVLPASAISKGIAALTTGVGRLGRAAAQTGGATVEGAVAGAGTADPGNRGEGAVLGGIAGGALGAAGQGVSNVAGRVAEPLLAKVPAIRDRIADQYLERFAGTDQKLADVPAAMRELGDQATPMDVSPGLNQLGRVITTKPGPTQDAAIDLLDARRAVQGDRILSKLQDQVPSAGRAIMPDVEVSPAFRKSLQKSFKPNAALVKEFRKPAVRAAYEKARTNLLNIDPDNTTLAYDDLINLLDPPAGSTERVVGISYEVLHRVKKELDAINRKRSDVTGRLQPEDPNPEVDVILDQARKKFTDQLKGQNPQYAKLLGDIAEKKSYDRARANGRKFITSSVDKLKEANKGLKNQMERRAYQQGVVDAVSENFAGRIANEQDISSGIIRLQPKLEVVFGKNKAAAIIKEAKAQKKMMREGNRIMGGSQTQPRQAAQEMFDAGPEAIIGAGTTRATMIDRALRLGLPVGPSRAVSERIGQRLLSQSPDELERVAARRANTGFTPLSGDVAEVIRDLGLSTAPFLTPFYFPQTRLEERRDGLLR